MKWDFFVQSVTVLVVDVYIAYLSPVGNLHQVSVLGVYHVSVSYAEQTSVQTDLCACSGSILLGGHWEDALSFWGRYFCVPCKWSAPVQEFSFGSTEGEAVQNVPVMYFSVLCVTPTVDAGHIFTWKNTFSTPSN